MSKAYKMDNIRNWFEDDSQDYDIYEYDGHLEAKTETAFFMVVEPHEGNKNKWLLRVAPISSFDRWANSTTVEEFFNTDIELCNYLYEHQLDIYKALLKDLSEDYDEICSIVY